MTPCACGEANCPGDGGGYYVSVTRGRNARTGARDFSLLLGPYETHAAALARVDAGRDFATRVDARACWYAFGTVRVEGEPLPTIFGEDGRFAIPPRRSSQKDSET